MRIAPSHLAPRAVGPAIAAVILTACGTVNLPKMSDIVPPTGNQAVAHLVPRNGSGTNGTIMFTQRGDKASFASFAAPAPAPAPPEGQPEMTSALHSNADTDEHGHLERLGHPNDHTDSLGDGHAALRDPHPNRHSDTHADHDSVNCAVPAAGLQRRRSVVLSRRVPGRVRGHLRHTDTYAHAV